VRRAGEVGTLARVTSLVLDDAALVRLKAAAEEIAFLSGRGYAGPEVKAFVAKHHALSDEQQGLLDRAVCSEPQYRARAMKEMLPEDIAKRPLLVDAHDVLDAITTALAGGVLLEGLDQTFQPLGPGGVPEHTDAALERLGPVLREMRPSKTRWLLDATRADAAALRDRIAGASKKWKVASTVELVDAPKATLRASANVATNDPAIIETSKSWCNLAGPVIVNVAEARRVKLQ
jgi:hypothetical protein